MNNKVAKDFLGQRRKKTHFILTNEFHRTVKQAFHLKILNWYNHTDYFNLEKIILMIW